VRLQSARPLRRETARPRNLFKLSALATAVNPLMSQDFHLFSTIRGVAIQRALQTVQLLTEELFTARSKTLSRRMVPKKRTQERKTNQKLKIAWRLCYARKPFRELSPRMRTPEGVSWRLTEFDAESHREDSAGSPDTGSLVLCRFVIPKRTTLRKGGIKKVTGDAWVSCRRLYICQGRQQSP